LASNVSLSGVPVGSGAGAGRPSPDRSISTALANPQARQPFNAAALGAAARVARRLDLENRGPSADQNAPGLESRGSLAAQENWIKSLHSLRSCQLLALIQVETGGKGGWL